MRNQITEPLPYPIVDSDPTRAAALALKMGARYGQVYLAPLYSGSYLKRGAYAAGTEYHANDVVDSGYVLYRCIATTTGNAPPNATYWVVLSDDWARWAAVAAVCATNGYTLHLLKGLWCCRTNQITPSKLHLVGNAGVDILAALTAHAPGGLESSSPFYNDGGFYLAQTTTVGVLAVVGALTFSTAAGEGSTIPMLDANGDKTRIKVHYATNGRCNTYEVIDVTGDVVTVNAPITYAFPIGSTVTVIPPASQCRDIVIEGNGMRISGTMDRAVEWFCGWDCHVYRLNVDGSRTASYVIGTDLGSVRTIQEDCVVDCGGAAAGGFSIEGARDCHGIRCKSARAVNGGGDFVLLNSDSSGYEECSSDRGNVGFYVRTNGAVDTYGATLVTLSGCKVRGALTSGAKVCDNSHNVSIVGCNFDACDHAIDCINGEASVACQQVSVVGCNFHGGSIGVNVNNGGRVTISDCNFENMTSHHVAVYEGEATVNACYCLDEAAIAGDVAILFASGASAILRVGGWTTLRTTAVWAATHNLLMVDINTSAVAYVDGMHLISPAHTPNYWLHHFDITAGTLIVDNIKCSNGATGIYSHDSADRIRMGKNVVFSSVDTPVYPSPHSTAGRFNFGTVQLNEGTAVNVAYTLTQWADLPKFTLKTAAGSGGYVKLDSVTADTGFAVSGATGDTSTHYWQI